MFIIYYSTVPLRAMLCWAKRRSRQKRREVQLRCSWRSWVKREISWEERCRSWATRWISWARLSRSVEPRRDCWSREQNSWRLWNMSKISDLLVFFFFLGVLNQTLSHWCDLFWPFPVHSCFLPRGKSSKLRKCWRMWEGMRRKCVSLTSRCSLVWRTCR